MSEQGEHHKSDAPPAWRARFLAALAEKPNVSLACKKARKGRTLAYAERKTDPEFAKAWDAALDVAVGAAEDEAWERGFSESDTLLIFMLKAHRPDKYRERLDLKHTGDLNLSVVTIRETIGMDPVVPNA